MKPLPFFDVRDLRAGEYASLRAEAAAALRDACLAYAPRWSHVCLRPIDGLVAHWLKRSASAYRAELEHVAATLAFPGALTLNMAYLFACTTSADALDAGAPILRRTLDWPFQGLGRCAEVALQTGPAGDFYNVTWPGAVGVLTAMAPGRFCAAINQAPMRRRTCGLVAKPFDIAVNLRAAFRGEGGWPPDHLLRLAFESCATFEDAVAMLAREPLARPTLFTLTGARPGEMALIERTEDEARILRGPVVVVNDWQTRAPGWAARMGLAGNMARAKAMRERPPGGVPFDWVSAPILNRTTRLAVEMSAVGEGSLAARGYEYSPRLRSSVAATQDFHLACESPARLAA